MATPSTDTRRRTMLLGVPGPALQNLCLFPSELAAQPFPLPGPLRNRRSRLSASHARSCWPRSVRARNAGEGKEKFHGASWVP